MKYTITWVQEKEIPKLNTSVLECTATDPNGNEVEFNIWMKDKSGAEFPNFKGIQAGTVVEGNMWQNPKDGKYSLYALKPQGTKPSYGGGGMKMMQEKAKNIEEAQKRKSESIAYFNSVNSAIAMLPFRQGTLKITASDNGEKEFIIYWRDWFISEYEKWDNQPF